LLRGPEPWLGVLGVLSRLVSVQELVQEGVQRLGEESTVQEMGRR